MKPIKTKAQIRAEIDSQIDSFLAKGGEVNEFDRGLSGRLVNDPLPKTPHIESTAQTRTPVLSEIQAIEARKHPPKSPPQTKRRQQDKKVLMTDDFGEPLRWISE